MIPFIQSKVVVRDSTGKQVVNGNCYPTAIACIIGIPPADVPNIETLWDVGTGYAYSVMSKWLETKGYKLNECAFQYSVFHEGSSKLKGEHITSYLDSLTPEHKALFREELKDKFYLVSGLSTRGVYHICVYKNGELVHDPHPTGEGISTEEIFEAIEKI
jgi:hypothetical protein